MNNELIKIYTNHLGKIFYNYMFFCLALTIISTFSFILVAVYWAILAMIVLLTLFIALFSEEFMALFGYGNNVMAVAFTIVPFAIGAGILFSILSLICFIPDRKNSNNKAKIITSASFIVIFTIGLIVTLFVMKGNSII